MNIDLKDLIENKKYIIVLDTNVILHIYLYSPEFSEYAIECLKNVAENIMIPSTVEIEYSKHQKSMFSDMKSKVESAQKQLKQQIDKAAKGMKGVCDNLYQLQFPDVRDLDVDIDNGFTDIKALVDKYFEDRADTLKLLIESWGKDDHIKEMMDLFCNAGRVMPPFSVEEIYRICDEGVARYKKKLPPGYKDDKKDNGLRKYNDLLIWKEILRYADSNNTDIIWVTNDVKSDWWESDDSGRKLHSKLLNEFHRTKQEIIALTSLELYDLIGDAYKVNRTDAVEYALKLTDGQFCERVSEEVFDSISDKLIYNIDHYIDESATNIGTEGISDIEIDSFEFISGVQTNREDDDIYYALTYNVVLSGESYDYWGRDDDTREIIVSPANYHKFEGEITVAIHRKADIFVDFEYDDVFKDPEIVDGELEETEYIPWSEEEDEDFDVYAYCPDCGCAINYSNDGGNGFCSKCAANH